MEAFYQSNKDMNEHQFKIGYFTNMNFPPHLHNSFELLFMNRKLSEVRRRKSGQSQKIDRLTLDNFIARNCGWFSLRYGESNFSFPL